MPADRPNVLVLQSDEHSFRCLGSCDDQRGEPVTTSAFDRLAENGTNFDQAYCQMPLCTPSRICTLTGREAKDCGAWTNWSVLPPDATTMPHVFGDAGYDTCHVGKMMIGGDRQYAGFDDRPYGDFVRGAGHQWEPIDRVDERTRLGPDSVGVTGVPESHLQEYTTMRESLSWIREREAADDDPWFVWSSFSRPHWPLTAPRRYVERYWDPEADEPTDRLTEPKVRRDGDTTDHPFTDGIDPKFGTVNRPDLPSQHDEQRARAMYFACVDFLDDVLDEFLGTLDRDGLLDDTVVVYLSDHGEMAGEHGLWFKHSWHEASTRVPLFVQTPAHRQDDAEAATIQSPVSLADLFPTLCGLTGVDPPSQLDGHDLSSAVEEGAEPNRGPVVCDSLVPRWGEGTEFRVVRDGDYKYVGFRDAPELLFDLDADPLEQTNLAPNAMGADREALDRLREYHAATMDFDAAERKREDDERLDREYALDADIPSPTGNCYHLPDGRVVDADTSLYDPDVLTDDPASTFSDYPE